MLPFERVTIIFKNFASASVTDAKIQFELHDNLTSTKGAGLIRLLSSCIIARTLLLQR